MWIVPRILFRPTPYFIAVTNSTMISPALAPAMVQPRIWSVPRFVSTFTRPVRLAVGDRAVEVVDAVGEDVVCDPLFLRLGLVQPTRATSGSVNVAHGITE
jgi:hypothetical protein